MVEEDKDKIDFFAGKIIFCYRKMLFGLKNARATYQRLVDKVFSDQIRRNLEAYVDDMAIKSTSEEDMLKDIQETFNRFWRSVSNVSRSLDEKHKCCFTCRKSLPGLEKLILALVHTVRRLRRYFQAHLIRVLTDAPIKQTLINLDKLGRIAKWAIELGEHDIKFKGRDITLPFLTYSSGS
ncbi:reverse transcriptase domain-containing protein [Tanacetum coccineum]